MTTNEGSRKRGKKDDFKKNDKEVKILGIISINFFVLFFRKLKN